MSVTDKFIEAGGIQFQYREAGSGAKTIVFLHGAGGQSPRGAKFPAILGERHRVLIPSRPGFDATPVGDCKTIRDVVEAVDDEAGVGSLCVSVGERARACGVEACGGVAAVVRLQALAAKAVKNKTRVSRAIYFFILDKPPFVLEYLSHCPDWLMP